MSLGKKLVFAIDRGIGYAWPGQSVRDVDPTEIAWWERPARWLFMLLLLAVFPIMVNRAVQHHGGTDFPAFYQSAKYLFDNGERHHHSEFLRYLPSADVPWVLLATLPLPAAAVVYYLFCCWSWIGLLDATGYYFLADCARTKRRQIMLLVGLLVMPIALDGFAVGAFHAFMVWMMIAGLCRIARNQTWRGGLLLGLAIWVKLLPALGAAYLLLKRKWQPALIALVAVLVADVVLSIVGYGPVAAWQQHVTWWHDEGSGALNRQLSISQAVDEDRITNQSVAIILRRVLTTFGMEGKARDTVSLAHLSSGQLKLVFLAIMGVLGLVGVYYCRRSWTNTSPDQWSTEIALMLLGTLWFSPVVWGYHPTSVVPAMALVLNRSQNHRWILWVVVAVWLIALAMFAVPPARAVGHLMLASLFLGAALVWVSRPSGIEKIS